MIRLATMKRNIVIIAHDIRSTHNIGSLLRTAEGLGIDHVYITGYSPYPLASSDKRLPHLAQKTHRAIQKTALGAEESQSWSQHDDINDVLRELKQTGYCLAALEQAPNVVQLPSWQPPQQVAVLLGREVEGIENALLQEMDVVIEIPMFGSKESFNVVQAAAMVMYHLRFTN